MDDPAIVDMQNRRELYAKTRDDLLKRQLSNSENTDRAVLTVATAALGFSLTFIKDIVPFATAAYLWLLYLSWISFVLAIVGTLFSFYTSQRGIAIQLILAERYYLRGENDAFETRSKFAKITDWLNNAGSVLFVIGIFATCGFVATNLGRETQMAERKPAMDGASISNLQKLPDGVLIKGANIPAMQPLPQGGAPIPTMEKPPAPPPTPDNGGKK